MVSHSAFDRRSSNPIRIAVFNHKGGVGKTTLTVNIADALAAIGKRILLVDSDPQCNLTAYLVEDSVVDDLLDNSDSEKGQTVWSAIKPINDGNGDLRLVEPLERLPNVYLLPGDEIPRDKEDEALVSTLVGQYLAQKSLIRNFLGSLDSFISGAILDGGPLAALVHSVKFRMKDPTHLREKLFRKMAQERAKGEPFGIDTSNLFLKINDLGGYRVLHLHTSQTSDIHRVLLDIFEQASFDLHEAPYANIWDDEARKFFSDLGIRTELNPRMYSSVHYVLKARSINDVTLEVQVRTLADEIWGEIDHKINYPEAHPSVSCREQIRVLARVASSCSRLVDSIMVSHVEYDSRPAIEPLGETSEHPIRSE